MTREEYIKFANALKNNYTIDFDKLPEFCDMAISALSEIKRNWIPVSERLPEVGENGLSEWVLVTTKGIDKTVTMYDRICHGEWLTPCFDGEEVLAWQPLPEPYKAERG